MLATLRDVSRPWVLDGHERMRLGKMTNPVRGLLHGSAALVFLVLGILLTILNAGGAIRRLSLLMFTISLVGLFTVSSLYHSVPWRTLWKNRMQRLDHFMIHVLVAGTFTPIAWVVFDGWLRWVTLSVQWGIVAIGAIQKARSTYDSQAWSIALATTQGWLATILFWPLALRLPWTALMLVGLGGVLYTGGMVLMVINRPKLWPRVFSSHEVFHILVVAASAVHFAFMVRYVAHFNIVA